MLRAQKGFSLIELIITLAIVGILAVLLMPAYRNYISRGNRSDAVQSILSAQIAEEKYRLNHATYGTLAQIGASATSPNGNYTIVITNNAAATYTITATTTGSQTTDTSCTTFTLAYSNGTTTKTSSPTATCWTQ